MEKNATTLGQYLTGSKAFPIIKKHLFDIVTKLTFLVACMQSQLPWTGSQIPSISYMEAGWFVIWHNKPVSPIHVCSVNEWYFSPSTVENILIYNFVALSSIANLHIGSSSSDSWRSIAWSNFLLQHSSETPCATLETLTWNLLGFSLAKVWISHLIWAWSCLMTKFTKTSAHSFQLFWKKSLIMGQVGTL